MYLILYAVVQEGWEYNDETHYRPESEGYEVVDNKLYQTKQEAEDACLTLNNTSRFKGYLEYDDEQETWIEPFKVIQLEL